MRQQETAMALRAGQSEVEVPNKPSWVRRAWSALGPGLITGASDDDPSGIATYSQAGAQFGFAICWTMLLTYPLMAAIQEISARIGRTTGRGIAGNIARCYPDWLLHIMVALLVIANTINIGADLGAMGDAVNFLVGGPQALYIVMLAAICATLQIFVSYTRYAATLRWLTLALFSYFATVLTVEVPWREVARGLFIPTLSADVAFWTTVVAVFGTTISPYLFFWQASQEAENLREDPGRTSFKAAPKQFPREVERIRIDTYLGMAFSNLVALAIIVTTAATLHVSGITDIQTSAEAAKALEPVAGRFASVVFALGILGTGLLAVPVLAGAAGYALGEALKWPVGLARQPGRAKRFYATIALATMAGAGLNFIPISPIKALFWSAVINGVVAVPVMVIMMLMVRNSKVMGKFPVKGTLGYVGWAATGAMALASLGMFLTALL
jgi:NRAMP (natural resistance-associated macrophage protein)-like metal ion transporter